MHPQELRENTGECRSVKRAMGGPVSQPRSGDASTTPQNRQSARLYTLELKFNSALNMGEKVI